MFEGQVKGGPLPPPLPGGEGITIRAVFAGASGGVGFVGMGMPTYGVKLAALVVLPGCCGMLDF
jgi:hypothetical protein